MREHYQEEAFYVNGDRNPYYRDPIVPEPIHPGPIHPDCRPRTVSVEENVKVAEIRDAFLNLRYKVCLTSFDNYYDHKIKQYLILVVLYSPYRDPIVIVNKPLYHERPIRDYDCALKLYDEYVANYTHLVKAETRDFQDIHLYEEQIGYVQTHPKCCYTCKWCKMHLPTMEGLLGEIGKLECFNPKNCQSYNFDSTHRHEPWHEHCHDPHDFHNCDCNAHDFHKLHDHMIPDYDHWHHLHDCIIPDIHPNVDIFGICKNYEQRTLPYKPLPNEKLGEVIDKRVSYVANNIIPEKVEDCVTEALTEQNND